MVKISAIILTDNREELIENCLKSILWVDEKIIIALGSTDKTLVIAKKYGCRIIKGSQEYDFSKWRDQGAKAAQGEWLLYIDTDERVTASLGDEIKNKILKINAYFIPRNNFFWGKEFKTTYPDYQLRLIKKSALLGWKGNIHEIPLVKGEIGKLNNPLIHLSHRSLESALENTLKWSWLEAENRFKENHPKMTSLRFLRIILTAAWQEFMIKKIWREGTEGVIEGIYQVFSLFITYFRLWELQKQGNLKTIYQKEVGVK